MKKEEILKITLKLKNKNRFKRNCREDVWYNVELRLLLWLSDENTKFWYDILNNKLFIEVLTNSWTYE